MTDTRFRLVVMGDSYVGKSSIIKRFLYGTFNIDYVATVEDLFSQDFEVGGTCLKVDILDTAGDAQFPAMRRYIRKVQLF
jgi:Ras-related protein Rap-1B